MTATKKKSVFWTIKLNNFFDLDFEAEKRKKKERKNRSYVFVKRKQLNYAIKFLSNYLISPAGDMKGDKLKHTNRNVVNLSTRRQYILHFRQIVSLQAYREFVDRGSTRRRVFPLTMINSALIFQRDTTRSGRLRYSAARQGSVKSLSVAELASNLIDHREAFVLCAATGMHYREKVSNATATKFLLLASELRG